MTTIGSPEPRSMMFSTSTLVPQWFSGFQRVLNAFLRLPFGNKAQKRLAFQIQQILLGKCCGVGKRSTRHDRRELPANERVVIADASGTPGEMDAEFQRREDGVTPDRNCRSRRGWLIAFGNALQRSRLRVRNQSLAVHRHRVHGTQVAE